MRRRNVNQTRFPNIYKKSVKRHNEAQQFIVNNLLTGGQILADNKHKNC